jgi:glycosyltransferase involved in cell wall biosynthesis
METVLAKPRTGDGNSPRPKKPEIGRVKILFVSTRKAKPSFRFRVEQVLPFYRANGHECEVAFLPDSLWSRFQLYRSMKRFDVVFIQKRLLSRPELHFVRRNAKRLIYDLDDAIMFNGQGVSEGKRGTRFRAMVRTADLTICGNQYLAELTSQHTDRWTIIPTPIDADRYQRCSQPELEKPDNITIGWTGSRSTNRYLNGLFPVLSKLSGNVAVKIISDVTDGLDFERLGRVPFTFIPWSPEIEISETATFDIGVMPLPDDLWTRGKCGFKALQYMSLGIPAVCSPVGVNSTIITHGQNGFLANSSDEWFQCLSKLVDESSLRNHIGTAARTRIETAYALAVVGSQFVAAIQPAFARQSQIA